MNTPKREISWTADVNSPFMERLHTAIHLVLYSKLHLNVNEGELLSLKNQVTNKLNDLPTPSKGGERE